MKRSSILEARRKAVSPEVRRSVELSFLIVNRINDILQSKRLQLKDPASLLGREEAEGNQWMRATHSFTLDEISEIENVLGERILCAGKPLHSDEAKSTES